MRREHGMRPVGRHEARGGSMMPGGGGVNRNPQIEIFHFFGANSPKSKKIISKKYFPLFWGLTPQKVEIFFLNLFHFFGGYLPKKWKKIEKISPAFLGVNFRPNL